MLHVIQDSDLRAVEREIINAARNACDLRGKPIMVATIDSRVLRQAAKIAVSMAIADDVWDGAETLRLPAPKRQQGFVDIETE
jgi:hypothetical protein